MNVLLSIKPEWAKKIYSGEKTIEFRKNFPLKYNLCDDYIFLYETKPVFAVTVVTKELKAVEHEKGNTGK